MRISVLAALRSLLSLHHTLDPLYDAPVAPKLTLIDAFDDKHLRDPRSTTQTTDQARRSVRKPTGANLPMPPCKSRQPPVSPSRWHTTIHKFAFATPLASPPLSLATFILAADCSFSEPIRRRDRLRQRHLLRSHKGQTSPLPSVMAWPRAGLCHPLSRVLSRCRLRKEVTSGRKLRLRTRPMRRCIALHSLARALGGSSRQAFSTPVLLAGMASGYRGRITSSDVAPAAPATPGRAPAIRCLRPRKGGEGSCRSCYRAR